MTAKENEPQVLCIQAAGTSYVFDMPGRQDVRDTARKLLTQKFLEIENEQVFLLVTLTGTVIVGMPRSAYMAQQQQQQQQQQRQQQQEAEAARATQTANKGNGPRIVAP